MNKNEILNLLEGNSLKNEPNYQNPLEKKVNVGRLGGFRYDPEDDYRN